MFKYYTLVFIFCAIFILHCQNKEYESACNPKSQVFLLFVLLRNSIKDSSLYCNTTFYRASNSDSQQIPSIPTIIPSTLSGYFTTPQIIDFTTSPSGGIVKCTTDGTIPNDITPTWTKTPIYPLAGLTIQCGIFENGVLKSSISKFNYSYSLPLTGQTTTYVAGDNGTYQTGIPKTYIDNLNGTITDNYTGLLWQKCSRGLSGSTCASGTINEDSW
jgi:hypothetical protein